MCDDHKLESAEDSSKASVSVSVLALDSAGRTSSSACAAIDASISVDRVDIALRDCAYGTLIDASATSYTAVSDYVCHNSIGFKLSIKIICDVTPALSYYIAYLSCFGGAKIQ